METIDLQTAIRTAQYFVQAMFGNLMMISCLVEHAYFKDNYIVVISLEPIYHDKLRYSFTITPQGEIIKYEKI